MKVSTLIDQMPKHRGLDCEVIIITEDGKRHIITDIDPNNEVLITVEEVLEVKPLPEGATLPVGYEPILRGKLRTSDLLLQHNWEADTYSWVHPKPEDWECVGNNIRHYDFVVRRIVPAENLGDLVREEIKRQGGIL